MGKKLNQTYKVEPLFPGEPEDVTIEHDYNEGIVQYEFYIPAAIWRHSAVKNFISQLTGKIDPSGTIFKGMTGVWEGEEEDTYIYRLIFDSSELSITLTRRIFNDLITEMMAKLSEHTESAQEAFLFTENVISATLSKMKTKPSNLLLHQTTRAGRI